MVVASFAKVLFFFLAVCVRQVGKLVFKQAILGAATADNQNKYMP
jgi:hypothetical protein